MEPTPDASRAAHEHYAYVNSYFWLPCPLCEQMFGGHEWLVDTLEFKATVHFEEDPPYMSVGICPKCTMAGRGGITIPRPPWEPYTSIEPVSKKRKGLISWLRTVFS